MLIVNVVYLNTYNKFLNKTLFQESQKRFLDERRNWLYDGICISIRLPLRFSSWPIWLQVSLKIKFSLWPPRCWDLKLNLIENRGFLTKFLYAVFEKWILQILKQKKFFHDITGFMIKKIFSENGKSKDRSVEDIKERFNQIQAVTSKQVQKVTFRMIANNYRKF